MILLRIKHLPSSFFKKNVVQILENEHSTWETQIAKKKKTTEQKLKTNIFILFKNRLMILNAILSLSALSKADIKEK